MNHPSMQFLGEEGLSSINGDGCCGCRCVGGSSVIRCFDCAFLKNYDDNNEKDNGIDNNILVQQQQQGAPVSPVPFLPPRRKRGRKKKNDDETLIVTEGFEKLSLQEREQALAELHGVADTIDETPEFLNMRIQQLSLEIAKVRGKKRTAYDKAAFLNPKYVESRTFRLLFLRCERFDVKKTTTRLMKHFETKLELFGLECLGRSIRFDDLTDDAKTIFLSGAQWFTKLYDRSGRRLYLITAEQTVFKKPIDYLRACWYIRMVAAEDVKTQRYGAIMVIFCTADSFKRPFDIQSILQLPKITKSTPIMLSGVHFCYEDRAGFQANTDPIVFVQKALDVFGRLKFRMHHASPVEMKYALMSYGITSLPLDADGHLKYEVFVEEVEERKVIEEAIKEKIRSLDIIECPTETDVLFGRGRPYQDFPGTILLNQLVEIQRPEYDMLDKTGKTGIVANIVQAVYELGGRFLKRSTDGAVDDDADGDETGGGNNTGTTANDDATALDGDTNGRVFSSSWEVVEDYALIHRKVSNAFQTRKRRQ